MFDHGIESFYNNVKDTSWPKITSYAEFVQLPDSIKKECFEIFNLDQQKKEICNIKHTHDQVIKVFARDGLAFVPMLKCASTHYANIFHDLGWEYVPLASLPIETTLFGAIIHPLKKHAKGFVEWLTGNYTTITNERKGNPFHNYRFTEPDYQLLLEQLEINSVKQLISTTVITNWHTMPYFFTHGELMTRIHWIPVDTLTVEQQAHAIENLCKLHNVDITIPIRNRDYASSPDKLKVYDIVTELHNSENYRYQLLHLFGQDLYFYYKILDEFCIDWSHLTRVD